VKITVLVLFLAAASIAFVVWQRGREGRWIREQRAEVIDYLVRQGVKYRGVSLQPAWFVSPYVAVWSVESQATPHVIGWWAISGDLPTDYVSGHDAHDPRSVLSHFGRQWGEASAAMLRGEPHPEMAIGTPDKWPELGDLLQRRSQLLIKFSEDPNLWK
jgi:Domain of unknown function (DUF4826)